MTGDPKKPEEFDRKTSQSICDAVGERLQRSLEPRTMGPAPQLDRLVEEMRRREGGGDRPPRPGRRFSFFR